MELRKIFKNKKWICEYLGKNDRHLIERMIKRWEIVKTEEWYELFEKTDIRWLLEEVGRLRDKVSMQEFDIEILKGSVETEKEIDPKDVEELKNRIKKLEWDLKFSETEYNKLYEENKKLREIIENKMQIDNHRNAYMWE